MESANYSTIIPVSLPSYICLEPFEHHAFSFQSTVKIDIVSTLSGGNKLWKHNGQVTANLFDQIICSIFYSIMNSTAFWSNLYFKEIRNEKNNLKLHHVGEFLRGKNWYQENDWWNLQTRESANFMTLFWNPAPWGCTEVIQYVTYLKVFQ